MTPAQMLMLMPEAERKVREFESLEQALAFRARKQLGKQCPA